MKTKTAPHTATPPAKEIPNPPGGGRWKWDATEEKWIPNEPPIEAPSPEQE